MGCEGGTGSYLNTLETRESDLMLILDITEHSLCTPFKVRQ